METKFYNKQVDLLLTILPEIAKEKDLALHGGTAINLFIREMPRLSVDVDLTYIPIEDRSPSLQHITAALRRICMRIQKIVPKAQVLLKEKDEKILVNNKGIIVKIEVNQINRGTLTHPVIMRLCQKAQNEYNVFCAIRVVPFGQLFGGKVCAALDRQHPRDLFDIKYLLANEGIREDVKQGFLLLLLSSERPMHELLNPHLLDQRSALENQFSGMTDEYFSYTDYEDTRHRLIDAVRNSLTEYDKKFLLNILALTPDWSVYNFQQFPAVQWKVRNLGKLKQINPMKCRMQYDELKKVLSIK